MRAPLCFILLAILTIANLVVAESPTEDGIAPAGDATAVPGDTTSAPGDTTAAPGDVLDGLTDGNEHSRNLFGGPKKKLVPQKGIVGRFIDLFKGNRQGPKPQGGRGTPVKPKGSMPVKLVSNLSLRDGTRIIVYMRRFRVNRDGSLTNIDFNDRSGTTIIKTYRRIVLTNGDDKVFEIPSANDKLRVLSSREFPDGTYVIVTRKKTVRRLNGNEIDIEYDDGPFSSSILLRTTLRIIFPSGQNIFYQLDATRRVNIVSYTMEPDGTLVIVFHKRFRRGPGGYEVEVDINFNAPDVTTKIYAVRIYRNRRVEVVDQTTTTTTQKQFVSKDTIGARDSPHQRIILSYTEYDGTKIYIIRLRIRVLRGGAETEVDYRDSSPSSKIITVIRRVTIDRKIYVIRINGAELPRGFSSQNGHRRLIVTYPDPDGTKVYVYRVRVALRPDGEEEEVDDFDNSPGFKRTVVITIIKRVAPDGKVTTERIYPSKNANVPSQVVQIIYRIRYTLQLLIDTDPKHRILVSQAEPDGTLLIIYRVRVRKEPDGSETEVDPTDNKPGTFVVIVKKVVKPSGEVTETKTYPSNPSSLTSKPNPSAPAPQQPQATARPLGDKEKVIETKVEPDGSVITVYQIVGTKNPDGSLAEIDDKQDIPNYLRVTFTIKRVVKPDGSTVDTKINEVTPRPPKNAPTTTPTPPPQLIENDPNHRMQTMQVGPDGTKTIVYRVRILKLADGSEAELDYDDELPDSVIMKVLKIVRPSGKFTITKTELRRATPKTTTTPRPPPTTTTTPSPQVNEIVEILPPPKTSNPQTNPPPQPNGNSNDDEDPKHKVTDAETEPDGTRRITYIVRVILLPDGTEKELDFNDPTPDSFVIKVIKTIKPDGSVSETKFTENTVDVTEAPVDKPIVVTTAKPSQLAGLDPVLLPSPGSKQKVVDVQRYPDGRIVVIIQVKVIVSPDGTVIEADDWDTSPNLSIKQIEKAQEPDGSIAVSENILPVSAANSGSNKNGPDSFDETTFSISSDTTDPAGNRKIVYQKTVQVQPDGSETIVPETELTPGTIRIIVEKLIRPDGRIRIKTIRRVITESSMKHPEESDGQDLDNKPDIDFSTFRIIEQATSADGSETTVFRKVIQKLPDGSERVVETGNDRQPGNTIIRVERITRPSGSVEIKVSKKTISGKPVSSGSPNVVGKPQAPGKSEPDDFKVVKQATRPDGSQVVIYKKVIFKQPDGTEVPADEYDRRPGVIIVLMQRVTKPGGQIEISQMRIPAEQQSYGNDYALLFTQKVGSTGVGPSRRPFNPSEYSVVNTSTEVDGSIITIYRKVIRVRPDGTEIPTDDNDSSPDAVIVTVHRTQRPDGTVIIRETRQSVPTAPEIRLPDGRLFNPDEYTFVSDSKEDDGTILTTYRQVVQVQPDGSEVVLPDGDEENASGLIYIITIEKRVRPSGTVSIRMRKRRVQKEQVGGVTINVHKIQVQPDGTHLALFTGDGGPSSLTNGDDDAPASASQFDPTGFQIVGESVGNDGAVVTVYRKKIKLRQDGTELILADDDQSAGATVVVVEKRTLKDGTIIIKETRSSAQKRQPSNEFSWVPLKLYPGFSIVESSTDSDGSQIVIIQGASEANGKVVRKKLRRGTDGKVREEALGNGDSENYMLLESLQGNGKPNVVDYENDRTYKLASSNSESDGTEVKVFKKRVRLGSDGKETDVDYADWSSGVYVKTVEMRRRPSGSVSISESFVPVEFKNLLK